MQYKHISLFHILVCSLSFISCKKLIHIAPPTGTITTSQVFSTDAQATAAATSLYYTMVNSYPSFASGGTTIFCGLSSDEFKIFDQTQLDLLQFQQNNLFSLNQNVTLSLWTAPYYIIYSSNAIIEGLASSNGVHDSVKNELTGEAKFVRAFSYFYLVNLFGDIPLATTVNWHNTNLLSRSSTTDAYGLIISDLKNAQTLLASDYSVGHQGRIIPNKAAAAALLARVYLYTKKWADAESQATSIIENSSYLLEPNLNDVFSVTSKEAIWQLQQDNKGGSISYSATAEGYRMIPFNSSTNPFVYLTSELLNTFEPGDLRRENWINETSPDGVSYHYPFKYKLGKNQASPDIPYSEYYTPLRLAEQYLIRSEARAQQNHLEDATKDLNAIRKRAGLAEKSNLSQNQLFSAIAHERQVELFAEWGHRWMDLKRTNEANTVLPALKSNWSVDDQLYPIPLSEISTDPNLTQNHGY